MCGICGKLEFQRDATVDPALLDRMLDTIHYRGPDGRGRYQAGPVGLGHARLAIIDLGTGAQPMANEDQTVWVVYNGEMYNFLELRQELQLKGHKFRSASDTEVIVHLYEEYGVDSLRRLRGMFAFALWDGRTHTLLLARDRLGIKPLYYSNTGSALVFGSEIKSVLADPAVRREPDPNAIDTFLTHMCMPGQSTFWRDVQKLEPGHYLIARGEDIGVVEYWDVRFEEANRHRSLDDAAAELRDLITRTVCEHMVSDVPVGFLLSGGLDSSIVLACASTQAGRRLSTFTVGFESSDFEDERPYAQLVAQRFATEHHEVTFSSEDFWAFLPRLVWLMEEPVCDPPAVSLHYVAALAKRTVKVVLSGEGGDEAFGGYSSYRNFSLLERAKQAAGPFAGILPRLLALAGALPGLHRARGYVPYAMTPLPEYYYGRVASPFSYFNRNKHKLYSPDFHQAMAPHRSTAMLDGLFRRVADQPWLSQMQYIDTKTSLPDDLLIKADRMTMGNSLELRVPFLDHRVIEFAAKLPAEYRVKNGSTKRILRRAFRDQIPLEVLRRKKAGFPLPLRRWMQVDLLPRVRETVLSSRAIGRGYFTKQGLESMFQAAAQGAPLGKELFALVTLEQLHQAFVDDLSLSPRC